MNFLLDVHLPISLSKYLAMQKDCRAVHINLILQKWHTSDAEICRYADENNMILLTKDSDFKNSHFIKKTPKKLIRITLGNISNIEMIEQVKKYLSFIINLSEQESFYAEISKEQFTVFD